MKKLLSITLSIVLLFGFLSCRKEDPLEKERKALAKELEDNMALTVYKGVKITLRSVSFDKNENNIDSLLSGMQKGKEGEENVGKYTASLINIILGLGTSGNKFSFKETVELVKVFNKLKGELKNKNEDDYPTLLEVLMGLNNIKNNQKDDFVKTINWNNAKEHMVLSAALMAAKPLPPSFQLYETSKLDIPQLENTEIKPLAAMFKGIIMMQHKWYYLSEEALSQGIESLDAGNLQLEMKTFPSFFEEAKIDSKEAEIVQIHGLSCLMRGFVRTKIDDKKKKKLAVEDFELFIKDADKIGADNELVWLAGAYVYIKKEDNEKAIAYLDKLQNSEQFSDNEKDAIKEIKGYLSDRKPDKALNVVYDKVFIGKLVIRYLTNYISKTDWNSIISETEAGKQLIGIPELIDSEYKKVEKEMSVDGLKDKGKELLKDVL